MKIYAAVILLNLLSSDWYSDWAYRKVITNNNASGGDLTNFPLLLIISNDTDLAVNAVSDGHDILFTLKDGIVKLSHEIEYYSNGTIAAWIKLPVYSSSEQDSNVIYMYYGKQFCGDQQNKNSTWDLNFSGVYHMGTDPATGFFDSTVSNHHGTIEGLVSSNLVAGRAGRALYFKPSSTRVTLPDSENFHIGNTSLTWEMWICGATNGTTAKWLGSSRTARGDISMRQFGGTPTSAFGINYATNEEYGGAYAEFRILANGTFNATPSDWWYCAFTYNGANVITYSNGIQNTSRAALNNMNTSNFPMHISIAKEIQGTIDEVRISRTARSSNWLRTTYLNSADPINFRTTGAQEMFAGVVFTSITPAVIPGVANENTVFNLNAMVLTGVIASVSIVWGDGQSSTYSPGSTNISTDNFSHIYTTRSNFLVTAVVTSSSGLASTNSTVISTLPYRFYEPYNINFSYEPKGCLVKWNITSSANVHHYNLYRGNYLHARIEKPVLYEYLDERIIFGDLYNYWIEAVYSAGSAFSATNFSQPHAVYHREALIGTGGGNLDTLLSGLYVPNESLSGTCTLSMTILSNRHESFYESGKPVYYQTEINSSDIQNRIKGNIVLKFRIPATNGSLVFKPFMASGYTINCHKDKFFCAFWDGNTWIPLSTAVYEKRLQNNFSFLELETSVNRLGIYGVMYNPQYTHEDNVAVKNRLFIPGLNNPVLSSVQISFPNPDREQVKIQVFDLNGKIVKENGFNEWINFWSWDGSGKNGELAAPGLYVISIVIGGIRAKAINVHAYLLK